MTWVRAIVLWVGLLCVAAAPGVALVIDVNGNYQLTVIDTFANCTGTGPMTLNQSGASFTGVASLTLVSGVGCPSSLSGSITGTLSGNTISFAPTVGSSSFTGTVSNDGNFMSGTWGSNSNAHGTWSAIRVQHAPAPALSSWSLTGLALLLGWFGVYRLRRSRRGPA